MGNPIGASQVQRMAGRVCVAGAGCPQVVQGLALGGDSGALWPLRGWFVSWLDRGLAGRRGTRYVYVVLWSIQSRSRSGRAGSCWGPCLWLRGHRSFQLSAGRSSLGQVWRASWRGLG